MIRQRAAERWIWGGAYFGLAAVLIGLHILPVDIGPNGYPGPDILLCITFVWVLRRPQYLPPLLIAAVFLLTDILYMRPPGLWTALVVVATEMLRSREASLREQQIAAEMGTVAVVIVALHLVYWLVLLVFAVPQARIGMLLLQLIATLVAYPMIAAVARLVFKVQRLDPAEFRATRRAR